MMHQKKQRPSAGTRRNSMPIAMKNCVVNKTKYVIIRSEIKGEPKVLEG